MLDRFLTLHYYFDATPEMNFQYTKATLAVGLLLIIGGLALSIYRKKFLKDKIIKKMTRKQAGQLYTYGVIILFLLAIREANIPFLSMRIIWFILLGFFLNSAIRFGLTFGKEYNERIEKMKKQNIHNKYIPKKKK